MVRWDLDLNPFAFGVYFDPEKPGYRRLLEFFFHPCIHDPTTANRQSHQDYLIHHPGGHKSQLIRPGWTLPAKSAGLPKDEVLSRGLPVTQRSVPRQADLDSLANSMEVEVAALTECLVGPGWRLHFAAANLPAIHYTLSGSGRIRAAGQSPFILRPHTLVVVPPDRAFYIEGGDLDDTRAHYKSKEANVLAFNLDDHIQTFRAGDDDPKVSVICGYFRASYGLSIDLFSTLRQPIVEHFDTFDHLADNLQTVLAEINGRQVGMRAMTAAALKQVFVTLLRRSLMSAETWTGRFALLSDPQIARAFADMAEMPGAQHSVEGLALAAGLSRSAFMDRFQRAFGQPPMLILRDLRMRLAAKLLETKTLTIDQVARAVGYNSRSSFSRAFRQAHGVEPKAYRATGGASQDGRP